ncbi:MAG: transposase [Candidatus Zambryskibacteria bacterium]|nr:transposase [Candidatus Zambryskibacteria bacterium]
MPRAPRIDLGNYVYHVINRSNGRSKIFHNDADYQDFEYLLNEIKEEYDMRILAYVIMPNHWHLLLYPRNSGDLSKALQWLSTSHAVRHHTRKGTIGGGHLYQGRYKSFLVEKDSHFLAVLKYIERNPARAKLCKRVEDWKWGSAYRRAKGAPGSMLLAESPIDLPRDYKKWINQPELAEQLKDVRESVNKGMSFGNVIVSKNIIQ